MLPIGLCSICLMRRMGKPTLLVHQHHGGPGTLLKSPSTSCPMNGLLTSFRKFLETVSFQKLRFTLNFSLYMWSCVWVCDGLIILIINTSESFKMLSVFIILLLFLNNPIIQLILFIIILQETDSKHLSGSSRITHLGYGRVGIRSQVVWLQFVYFPLFPACPPHRKIYIQN